MISGLDLDQTVDYILERDKENPTVWKLGILSSVLYTRITSTTENPLEAAFKCIQIGLKGWDNFDIPFRTEKETIFGKEYDVIPLDIVERISMKDLTELYDRILVVNNLKEDERKN